MKTSFMLSYDLGIDGDYEGLYLWLDSNGARECGDSVAFIKDYEYKGDFFQYIKKDIEKSVSIQKNKNRIYVFNLQKETPKGLFIFGKRKRNPWEGAALNLDLEDVFEDE